MSVPPCSSGNTRPEEPEVAHLPVQLARELAGRLELGDPRPHLLAAEVAHELADRLVLLTQQRRRHRRTFLENLS